jgi:hypothetical protein
MDTKKIKRLIVPKSIIIDYLSVNQRIIKQSKNLLMIWFKVKDLILCFLFVTKSSIIYKYG